MDVSIATSDSAAPPMQHIVREALSLTPEGDKVYASIAAKCGWDVEVGVEIKPFGGAQTFADVDAYTTASQRSAAIHEATWQFEAIVNNIMAAEDVTLDEKARRVAAVAGELETRIARDDAEMQGTATRRGFLERVKSWLGGDPAPAAAPAPTGDEIGAGTAPGVISMFKDASGRYRYVAVATNRYEDKEGEIFSAKAHREYVAWANATKNYPELWLVHRKGSRLGVADAIAYDEETGFRVSTGLFDPGMDHAAEALIAEPSLAMSHGYVYTVADRKGGVYERYRTFEESVLPSAKIAANVGTAFTAWRREDMGLKGEEREFFVRVLGEDRTRAVEANLSEWAKDYAEAGVRFKAILEEAETTAAATDETASAEAAETTATTEPASAEATAPTEPAGEPEAAETTAATEPAGEPDASESVKVTLDAGDIVAQLKTVLAPIADTLADLNAWRSTVDEALGTLSKSAEDTLADLIRPRAVAPTAFANPPGVPAGKKGAKIESEMEALVKAAESEDGLGDDVDANVKAAMPLVGMLKGRIGQ